MWLAHTGRGGTQLPQAVKDVHECETERGGGWGDRLGGQGGGAVMRELC